MKLKNLITYLKTREIELPTFETDECKSRWSVPTLDAVSLTFCNAWTNISVCAGLIIKELGLSGVWTVPEKKINFNIKKIPWSKWFHEFSGPDFSFKTHSGPSSIFFKK